MKNDIMALFEQVDDVYISKVVSAALDLVNIDKELFDN